MSAPEPSSARNGIVLPATWSARHGGGGVSVVATKLPEGRIEFAPRASDARAFTVEEDELIKALLRWGPW